MLLGFVLKPLNSVPPGELFANATAFGDSLLSAADLSATLAINCLPEVSEKMGALRASAEALPGPGKLARSLNDAGR